MTAQLSSDLIRGHTDTIVLGILRRGDNYGFAIYKEILDATGREYELKEATLYASFRRLVTDGCVEAYWGDETQGGRRKYYRITDVGRAVYRRNKADWDFAQRIINRLLADVPGGNAAGGTAVEQKTAGQKTAGQLTVVEQAAAEPQAAGGTAAVGTAVGQTAAEQDAAEPQAAEQATPGQTTADGQRD